VPRGRERSLTTPPTTPSEPRTAIAVSTATTAVSPFRRRGAPTVGGKVCHPRSGLGGVQASGLLGGGVFGERSIRSIVGGVSANDAPAGALPHDPAPLERPIDQD